MKVLFWNLEGASPLTTDLAKKGADVANLVTRLGVDVMIFSEILEAAPEELAIDELRMIQILVNESTKSKEIRNPLSKLPMKTRFKMKSGMDELGFEETGRRNPYRFKSRHEIRSSAQSMVTIKRATGLMNLGMIKHEMEIEMEKLKQRNKALVDKIDVSDLVRDYPYRYAHDAVQKNRNYLVFSKHPFKLKTIDVNVPGAKRPILRIDLGTHVIFSIHAPAFAKGGHETVNQLCTLISKEAPNTIAIGDMNIDVEELLEEYSAGNVPPLGVVPHIDGFGRCTPFQIQRRRRMTHTTITKTIPNSQKSGGTLDYCLANKALKVDASFVCDCGVMSDHAAVMVTY